MPEPAVPKEPLDTKDRALKLLAELNENIQNETGEKEKLVEGLGEVSAAVKELDLRMRTKARFASGSGNGLPPMELKTAEDRHKFLTTPARTKEQRDVQNLSDDLYLASQLMGSVRPEWRRGAHKSYTGPDSLFLYKEWQHLTGEYRKTMDTAETAGGTEWVPEVTSGELQRLVDVEAKVPALHRHYPMPTETWNLPILKSHLTAYRATEQVDADDITKVTRSKLGTGKTQFDAEKIGVRVLWTGELDESSVVPMLPVLREDIVVSMARGIEKGTIDGQATAAIDSGDEPDAADVRSCFDGYRYYAEDNPDVKVDLSAAFTIEGLTSLRKAMGKTALNPRDLAWVPSVSVFYQLLTLKDENDNPVVVPAYAYAEKATALTGELGMLQGIPVVPSEFVREDLNADGIYDGITETQTVVLLVSKPSWAYGDMRELTIRVSDVLYMESDILVIVAMARLDLQALFPYATQAAVAEGYNITA